jgi:hypothetical protein
MSVEFLQCGILTRLAYEVSRDDVRNGRNNPSTWLCRR